MKILIIEQNGERYAVPADSVRMLSRDVSTIPRKLIIDDETIPIVNNLTDGKTSSIVVPFLSDETMRFIEQTTKEPAKSVDDITGKIATITDSFDTVSTMHTDISTAVEKLRATVDDIHETLRPGLPVLDRVDETTTAIEKDLKSISSDRNRHKTSLLSVLLEHLIQRSESSGDNTSREKFNAILQEIRSGRTVEKSMLNEVVSALSST